MFRSDLDTTGRNKPSANLKEPRSPPTITTESQRTKNTSKINRLTFKIVFRGILILSYGNICSRKSGKVIELSTEGDF